MVKTLHFRSKAGYDRWLAFGHMHKLFDVPGNQNIVVHGKPVKVKHKRR